jgi:ATP-dependent Clp protease ATP-binding subunit ClpC
MYERFTDRARKVMMLADQEAQRLGSPALVPEHVLLGLLKEGSGVAANVLRALDVSFEAIAKWLEARTAPAPPAPPEHQRPPNRARSWWWLAANPLLRSRAAHRLPQSPESKALIEQSLLEARLLNHNYVGTEHLLLGLLRQADSRSLQFLADQGLKPDDVRQEVLNLLGHGI